MKLVKFNCLLGKKIKKIKKINDDEIRFYTKNAEYRMYGDQECCENIYIDDICGDFKNIVKQEILLANESFQPCFSNTLGWTFYNLATIKGTVTITWKGKANSPYYSLRAKLFKIS